LNPGSFPKPRSAPPLQGQGFRRARHMRKQIVDEVKLLFAPTARQRSSHFVGVDHMMRTRYSLGGVVDRLRIHI
jgi:hypothetical protein